MEQLAIVEKIYESGSDVRDTSTPMYIFSAAIYDTWISGSELEKNLIERFVEDWSATFVAHVKKAYLRATEFNYATNMLPPHIEYADFCKDWIQNTKKYYSTHKGMIAALDRVIVKEGVQG
jgi:hypothetical protein